MENIIIAPPSSPRSDAAEAERRSGSFSGSATAALSVMAAFAAVALLTIWGLGTAGALEDTAAVLYGAHLAAGVIAAVGFAAQVVDSLCGR